MYAVTEQFSNLWPLGNMVNSAGKFVNLLMPHWKNAATVSNLKCEIPMSTMMKHCITLHKIMGQTYLVRYLPLLVYLFYEAKTKPELGTVEKQVLIVKWQKTNFFVHNEREI